MIRETQRGAVISGGRKYKYFQSEIDIQVKISTSYDLYEVGTEISSLLNHYKIAPDCVSLIVDYSSLVLVRNPMVKRKERVGANVRKNF